MRILAIICAVFGTLWAAPAAATEEDFNVWTAQFIFFNLDEDKDWYARFEAQERFTDDADRLGQLLLRSFVGYRISDAVNVGGGYAYILTDPVGPVEVNEHRIYQELNVTLFDNGNGIRLTSRNRLEQRFYEESGSTGWRYRNLVQFIAPITERNSIVLYTEPFIGLNDVPFNREGVANWRNFAGVSFPLTRELSFTPGYLNQYVVRDGEDRVDHIVNLAVFARF
ncbi:DUF2490 domain-containing protein [Erythrobacter rubeus]|uniref:DUF2490 domain-containing protein n=1 Tax=Erythrobacter rubeus TaxID=2760803 RepID=A0ABR8KLL0_9SPHN|nr:DUF2490 domain-containing protein [Erythrobacter rubeus]MBD2841313.1 DUF2490 domain-containing protein [Erythrobacter rubeus]